MCVYEEAFLRRGTIPVRRSDAYMTRYRINARKSNKLTMRDYAHHLESKRLDRQERKYSNSI